MTTITFPIKVKAQKPIRCERCGKLLCNHMDGGLFVTKCPKCDYVNMVDRRGD